MVGWGRAPPSSALAGEASGESHWGVLGGRHPGQLPVCGPQEHPSHTLAVSGRRYEGRWALSPGAIPGAGWTQHRLWSLMGPGSNPSSATCYLNDLGQVWTPCQSPSLLIYRIGFYAIPQGYSKDYSYPLNSCLAQRQRSQLMLGVDQQGPAREIKTNRPSTVCHRVPDRGEPMGTRTMQQ